METKFKVMDIRQLADFVGNAGFDEECSFTADFFGEDDPEIFWFDSSWYGIRKTVLFEREVALVGMYGSSGHIVVDLERDDEELYEELNKFMVNFAKMGEYDKVCVNTGSIGMRKEDAGMSQKRPNLQNNGTGNRVDYWSSIKNNYMATEDVFYNIIDGDIWRMIYIDAWKTDDDNENGETIAKVVKTKSGDVCIVYQNSIARYDDYAQEIIQESVAKLRGKNEATDAPATGSESKQVRTYWCRVGTSIDIDEGEYGILCGEDRGAAGELLAKILRDPKKSRIDGNTYFPEEGQDEYWAEGTQDEDSSPAICRNEFDL